MNFFTGQWQTYPLPQNSPLVAQPPLPNSNIAPQIPKSVPNYFTPPLPPTPTINTGIQQLPPNIGVPPPVPHNPHVTTMGSYVGLPDVSSTVLPGLPPHAQVKHDYFDV